MGNAEAVFELVDCLLHTAPDFVSLCHLICPMNGTGISTRYLFRVNINHPPTERGRTGMIAVMAASILTIGIFCGFHFWTDKLKGGYAKPKMRSITFRLHR